MEKMPYRADMELQVVFPPSTEKVISTDWQDGLPTLRGKQVVLRELLLLRRERLGLPLTGEAGSIEGLPQQEIKKLADEAAAEKEAEQSSASH